MITPIYDYDIQLDETDNMDPRYAYGSFPTRHGSAYAPSLMFYPTDPNDLSHHDNRYSRRHRQPSYLPYSRSPTPTSLGSTNSDVYSDSNSVRGRTGRASSYSPPPRQRHRLDRYPYYEGEQGRDSHRYSSYPYSYNQSRTRTRERPPDDPIAQRPPHYQTQATHHQQVASSHAPHSGQHAERPPTSASLHAGRPPFFPSGEISPSRHSYNKSRRSRERPSDDPIAQHPPHYQTQATHHQQVASTHAPLQQQSAHTTGQHAGRPPTSASLHAGRPPFFPPGGTSASRPGSAFSPSIMGGKHAPSVKSTSTGKSWNPFEDMVKSYLKLLPPHPHWAASRLTGKKKAVCIGINYVGQSHELKGCFNDAKSVAQFLITEHQFPENQILLLTDVDAKYRSPTRKELFSAFMWLVKDAHPDDSLFIHYSGHGGQSRDASGREKDGMDDTIFPVDFQEEGDIIDDELHQALVQPLPAGCRLTALFDSCHSGTVLDLPYLHSSHGRLRGLKHITERAKQKKSGLQSDVICFAACKDDETSADTFEGGVAVGAMSHAFIQSLEQNRHQTYEELLTKVRKILVPKYRQKPQISCTNPLNVHRQFAL